LSVLFDLAGLKKVFASKAYPISVSFAVAQDTESLFRSDNSRDGRFCNIAVQLIAIHHQVRIQAKASQSKSDAYERSERCIGFAHNKDGCFKNIKGRD
jgi:hypothetical protein